MLFNCFFGLYKIKIVNASEYSEDDRRNLAGIVVRKFNHVDEQFVLDCFDRYPEVVVCYRQDSFVGIFFYNFFADMDDGYFYFGPLFFFTRGAFAAGTLTVMERYLRRFARVYFLAEVQNPELIVHLHAVFKRFVWPKPFCHSIDDEAKENLRVFQKNTPQLDAISLENFRSQGKSTLFYRSGKSDLVTTWLRLHGIDLAENQALVMLIELTWWKLFLSKLIICFRMLTYPSHKISYLNKLKGVLEAS